MSPSEPALSFGAERLLDALERRARAGAPQPHAGAWLAALIDEDRALAEEVAGAADLGALLSAAHDLEGGEPLDRAEVEARAAQHAAELGHDVIPPADVASAILAMQT